MVLGSLDSYDTLLDWYVSTTGVPFPSLAPAYIEVGNLDIFRDEDIAYAAKLASSGVPIELHVHPGAPHGFDRLAPGAAVTRRAFADRIRIISSL
jgi:acetyl esterase/lipase